MTFSLTENKGDTSSEIKVEDNKNNHWVYTNDEMFFEAGKEESHTYTLTVQWSEGKNDAGLAELPDYVQIKICVEQVD